MLSTHVMTCVPCLLCLCSTYYSVRGTGNQFQNYIVNLDVTAGMVSSNSDPDLNLNLNDQNATPSCLTRSRVLGVAWISALFGV